MNSTTWNFIQDVVSHCTNIVQDFLKEKLGKRFIKHTEWPLSSPDCDPVDYHFWNKIKEKAYEDPFNQPFGGSNELKRKTKNV